MKRLLFLVFLLLARPGSSQSWPPVPVQPNAQHTRIALVLYTYQGNTQPFSSTEAVDDLAYLNRWTKPFWEQNSFGHRLLDIDQHVYSYVLARPTGSPSGCLFNPDNAELQADYRRDVAAGTELILVHPCQVFDNGDYGNGAVEGMRFPYTANGTYGFVIPAAKLSGYADEAQGYIFGLPNAGYGLFCYENGVQVPLSSPANCSEIYRIGDPVEAKAGTHSSAADKFNVGWLSSVNRALVTQAGTYQILPAEVLTAGSMSLWITAPNDPITYRVEYRLPIGPDAGYFSSSCVFIHRDLAMLQMNPLAPEKTRWVCMTLGQTLTTPSGLAIRLQSMALTGATVQVTYGAAPPPPSTSPPPCPYTNPLKCGAPPPPGTCPYSDVSKCPGGVNDPNAPPSTQPPPTSGGCPYADVTKCPGGINDPNAPPGTTPPPTTTCQYADVTKCPGGVNAPGATPPPTSTCQFADPTKCPGGVNAPPPGGATNRQRFEMDWRAL